METEKDRIEKVMEKEGLNATQFASEIGIKSPTLSHILNGRNNPSLDVMKRILDRYRTINSDWLILGVGPMYRGIKQPQTLQLFDDEIEKYSEPTSYTEKKAENLGHEKKSKEEKTKQDHQDVPISTTTHSFQSRKVDKIIIYYDDNTFQEFEAK